MLICTKVNGDVDLEMSKMKRYRDQSDIEVGITRITHVTTFTLSESKMNTEKEQITNVNVETKGIAEYY